MRPLGITLLVVGFLWIAWDAAFGFTGYQHVSWMWHSKELPVGETIQRKDAVGAMRDLSLKLKDRHRAIFVPALLMFIGGLTAGLSRRTQSHDTPTA